MVDSFQNDPTKLLEIASPMLLTNLQQLVSIPYSTSSYSFYVQSKFTCQLILFQLVESPPVISTSTFISVLRMLTLMCAVCPELSLTLLKQCIADTLCYLLTGSAEKSSHFEVIIENFVVVFISFILLVYITIPNLFVD